MSEEQTPECEMNLSELDLSWMYEYVNSGTDSACVELRQPSKLDPIGEYFHDEFVLGVAGEDAITGLRMKKLLGEEPEAMKANARAHVQACPMCRKAYETFVRKGAYGAARPFRIRAERDGAFKDIAEMLESKAGYEDGVSRYDFLDILD